MITWVKKNNDLTTWIGNVENKPTYMVKECILGHIVAEVIGKRIHSNSLKTADAAKRWCDRHYTKTI